MVPEGRRLFRDMTVLENLEIGGYTDRARGAKSENLRWISGVFPSLSRGFTNLQARSAGGNNRCWRLPGASCPTEDAPGG